MTRLNTEEKFLIFPSGPRSDPEPARRWIVLVPALETDLTAVTHRVWELARATGARVKFLSLCSDTQDEPGLRRRLATMSAMLNSDRVSAEAEVIFGRNWVDAVKSRWQPGDVVVCWNEPREGLLHKPLSQILRSNLDLPLYILSGLDPETDPENNPRSNWLVQAAGWIGSIVILLGFLVLQVQIGRFIRDGAIVLQLLSLPIEVWAVLAWNSLLG